MLLTYFLHRGAAPYPAGALTGPLRLPAGLLFDIATALPPGFRHLAMNVATAVERWRHMRENCSVKIVSKNRICSEMRHYL